MSKNGAFEQSTERDVEVQEFNEIEVSVFDFKKDWALVEPHMNDPEVLQQLNEGMLEFSRYHGLKHLPLWDLANNIGPWEYARTDAHSRYALDKVNEDPEVDALNEKYERICSNEGFEFEEVFYEDSDPKKKQIFEAYNEEWKKIERKHLPQRNTYRWYQCFRAGCYLQIWQLALAEKVFPDFEWYVFEEEFPNADGRAIAIIGKGPNRKYLIFDICLFESHSADEILEGVGLDRDNLEREWEETKLYYLEE